MDPLHRQDSPLDVLAVRVLNSLSYHARGSGHTPGLADLAIATMPQISGYTVLTRNPRHFHLLAVPSHDPFESLPGEVR